MVSVISRSLISPQFYTQLVSCLLHEAILNGLAEAVDNIQASGALQLGEGWMHLYGMLESLPQRAECITNLISCTQDNCNLPPLNCIGNPGDIFASVRVLGGKVSLFSTTLVPPSVLG